MAKMFDIAVLGATPAGCAAACYLAARKARVALVDCPHVDCESPIGDWAPRGFLEAADLPKTAARSAGATDFRIVRYHDAKLARQVEYTTRGPAGAVMHAADLIKALVARAKKAGVSVRRMPERPAIQLGEDSVLLAGAAKVSARLLLVAQGRPTEVLSDLALPVRAPPQSPFVAVGLDVPLGSRKLPRHLSGVLNVAASETRGKLGLFFAAGRALHVRVVSSVGLEGPPAADLSALVARLQSADILPAKLPLGRARAAAWHPPAAEALDLETHAAKRCLLCGTAGGFVDTITAQTLAPSIRSAVIAADVALAALKSKDPQDALMRYKNEWRKRLADALRPPSTPVHMLLPLLFANKHLVCRFTRALLYGQSI